MTKVLLTGASGFIAAHILQLLLQRGHNVIITVRSIEKADKIRKAFSAPQLEHRIVEDIAQPGAFDEALKIEGLEVVVHTASPFILNVNDVKKDLLEPAVNGTRGILRAIKINAPSVKKVVITSSFASILDVNRPLDDPSITYTENYWNPVTEEQALQNSNFGYRASKTFAERAAWDFMEKEKPNFTLSTILPPLVFGPPIQNLFSLDSLNTSNQTVRELILGHLKDITLDGSPMLWIDVRDVALAHIKAFELDEAAGKRLFICSGLYHNGDIVDVIKKNFAEFASGLPRSDLDPAKKGVIKYDNSTTVNTIGATQYTLEQSISDTVKSFKAVL